MSFERVEISYAWHKTGSFVIIASHDSSIGTLHHGDTHKQISALLSIKLRMSTKKGLIEHSYIGCTLGMFLEWVS